MVVYIGLIGELGRLTIFTDRLRVREFGGF